MSEWLPIGLAPKDKPIMAFHVAGKFSGLAIAEWCEYFERWEDTGGFEIHPTHWMPLPDPPR